MIDLGIGILLVVLGIVLLIYEVTNKKEFSWYRISTLPKVFIFIFILIWIGITVIIKAF